MQKKTLVSKRGSARTTSNLWKPLEGRSCGVMQLLPTSGIKLRTPSVISLSYMGQPIPFDFYFIYEVTAKPKNQYKIEDWTGIPRRPSSLTSFDYHLSYGEDGEKSEYCTL